MNASANIATDCWGRKVIWCPACNVWHVKNFDKVAGKETTLHRARMMAIPYEALASWNNLYKQA